MRTPDRVEWPTLFVGFAIYLWFAVITYFHAFIPWLLLLPMAAYVTAWHATFQHEVIHGHPTPWRRLNELLAAPPLLLWLPYPIYRDSHLKHHRDEHLTDPFEDPESYYVSATVWARLGDWQRRLLRARNTLAGRLLLGPLAAMNELLTSEGRKILRGNSWSRQIWTRHLVALACVLVWVVGICGISLWIYFLFFVWPGTALIMLRAYLEHRADDEVGRRTVIVETSPLMSLLFLNNNLHAVHHAKPGLPWYRLPAAYARDRSRYLEENGGYLFKNGYREIVRRYLFTCKERPVHPST